MASPGDALLAALVARVRTMLRADRRTVLGIVGAPGSGKTTFADALADRLIADDPSRAVPSCVARVPMDGFHLADRELVRLGRLDRKGAPDTFDVAGYVALLRRLHDDRGEVVYAPAFDRRIEQPIAGSIPVPPSTRLVVTEGNYLLAGGAWAHVRPLLGETWYLEMDDDERLRRLVARHEEFGKSTGAAFEWAHGVDQRNAELIAAGRHHADLIVHTDTGRFEEVS